MKALVAAALTGAALAGAPTAQADDAELEFLHQINLNGVTISDAALAIAAGYTVCEQLNYETGEYVIPRAVTYYDLSPTQATVLVYSAVQELCPWHDHRDDRMYAQ